MPITSTAPQTGRDIMKRVLFGLVAAFATLTATPAGAQPATPAPVIPAPQQPSAPLAYYMMQGNRIISQPYASAPACMKALAVLKQSLPANVAPIVCAHRRPGG